MVKKIVYGLSSDLSIFQDLSPQEIGARLRAMGCTGVFMHHVTPEWSQALHASGLSVYISLGVFSGQGIWEEFPDAHPITAEGRPLNRVEWYEPAIPTHPGLRQRRLDDLRQHLSNAPLDGVWLDAIRWPSFWEHKPPLVYTTSFDVLTLTQFQADTQVTLPTGAHDPVAAAEWLLTHASEAWYTWRCQQIVTFVAEAKAILKARAPTAQLGLFTVPWTDADFDQANIRAVGQDLKQLAPHVDVISPMVYHRMCEHPPHWVGDVTRWVKHTSHCATWPIIEAVEPATKYPAAEFAAACQAALDADADALMVFTLKGLGENPEHTEIWTNLKRS